MIDKLLNNRRNVDRKKINTRTNKEVTFVSLVKLSNSLPENGQARSKLGYIYNNKYTAM